MDYPSPIIEQAVLQISKLPGIGKKSALRMVLHLLKKEDVQRRALSESLLQLNQVQYCTSCFNFSDGAVCSICASHRRDKSTLCVVEDCRDVLAIENTTQYQGLYHVLGGIISPVNGIGPSQLRIEPLMARAQAGVKEIILALPATMEGDTTAFYIHRKLQPLPVKVTMIARGVSIGSELEYTDEITLGRSIVARTLFSVEQKS